MIYWEKIIFAATLMLHSKEPNSYSDFFSMPVEVSMKCCKMKAVHNQSSGVASGTDTVPNTTKILK